MKKIIGPLGVGMIMGAALSGMYFLMPNMKNKKKSFPMSMNNSMINKD